MIKKDTDSARRRASVKKKIGRSEQSPLAAAQDLCFDAWDASSPSERISLAKRALQISPDCADAYVILANEAKSAKRRSELYAQGVTAGERALGPRTFEDNAGHFWGVTGTRPYMRARFGLAQSLWEMGRRDEAIGHCAEMLQLNPNDNQGVRYTLVRYLLEEDRDSDAEDIMNFYGDGMIADSVYSRLLLTFRKEGDSESARSLLWSAVRHNYHVPAFLLGKKPLPRILPDEFTLGYESEAVCYAASSLSVWKKTPGALQWLAKRLKWDSWE
ncbi:MAG TPA: hypothetical protein VFQ24_16050 [Terriglobia bacterium]|nr:hypothetical protein [Terriglobia bacterium]